MTGHVLESVLGQVPCIKMCPRTDPRTGYRTGMCAPGQVTGQLAGQVKSGFGNPQIPNCQKLWTNIGRACPIEPSEPVGAVKSRIPGGNFEITTSTCPPP